MSATVERAAIFASEASQRRRAAASIPTRAPEWMKSASASFQAMPAPQSSLNGYRQPGSFGSTSTAPSGSAAGGRWWSVTTT